MSQLVLGLHPCSPRSGYTVGCGLALKTINKILITLLAGNNTTEKSSIQNEAVKPPCIEMYQLLFSSINPLASLAKQYAFGNPSLGFPGERGFWLLLALVKVARKRYGKLKNKCIAN